MSERLRKSEVVAEGDVRIETFVDGNGPALVVLPSYGRDGGEDFDAFTELVVAAGWKVLRPQPRGIAGSVGPMTGFGLEALAGDVACVIDRLAGGRAVVLGHAFGNFIARVLAVERAAMVSGIVLAAAGARVASEDINQTPFIAGDPTRPKDERLAALRKAFFAPGHDPSVWLRGWYPETLAMQRAAVAATDTKRYWSGGSAPILEVIPRFDPFKPRSSWRELSDEFGDRVTSVVIDDAAHALFPEQPFATADAVIAWIAQFKPSFAVSAQ